MRIETLTLSGALYVANHMRLDDRECLEAVIGTANPEAFALNRWQSDGAAWEMVDFEPVAIGGLSQSVPWVGRLWLIATDLMTPESWKKLIRHLRTVLANASKTIRRIEADVLSTWPEAQKFIKRMGFELEGARYQAGKDGQDILTFVYRGNHAYHGCRS